MKYKQDHLRNLAERYINNPEESFETIKERDITPEFLAQYETYFREGTLVKLNFNGHTTDGKSTAMAKLVAIGNTYLGRKMSHKYILGNQQEYAYWVGENPKTKHIMLQIDEWSSLVETGANATVEIAYLKELSDINAQMYNHIGYCSPHQLPDDNILIHLEVASKDIKNKQTVCYIYYNLSRQGNTIPQIVGHIVLDVTDVLKSSWYKKYRTNKFKKMELLREHAIYHERELFYARIIHDIIKSFIGETQMGRIIPVRDIVAKAKIYCLRNQVRMTMLGIEYSLVTEIKPVLDLYVKQIKLENTINDMKRKYSKSNMPDERFDLQNKIQKMTEQIKSYTADIDFYLAENQRKQDLFDKYKAIQ